MRVFRALVGETGLRVAGPGQGSGGRRRVRAGARDAARRNSRSGTLTQPPQRDSGSVLAAQGPPRAHSACVLARIIELLVPLSSPG